MYELLEPLWATLLVLVVTDKTMVLAADSKKTVLHPDGYTSTGTMDKIFQTGDYYFALSGFNTTEDNRFSLPLLLDKVLLQHSDFDAAVKKIVSIVATELKHYFVQLKNTSADVYTQFKKYSDAGGEIVMVKRVGALPTAYLLDYKLIDEPSIKVVLNTWKITTADIPKEEPCFWRAIGHASFLKKGMPSAEAMAKEPVAKARWLIEEGIRNEPLFVGGPINILELRSEGVQWIGRTGTAPARIGSG